MCSWEEGGAGTSPTGGAAGRMEIWGSKTSCAGATRDRKGTGRDLGAGGENKRVEGAKQLHRRGGEVG